MTPRRDTQERHGKKEEKACEDAGSPGTTNQGMPGAADAGSGKDAVSLKPWEGVARRHQGLQDCERTGLDAFITGLLPSVLVAVSRPWFCLVLSVADNCSVQHTSSGLTSTLTEVCLFLLLHLERFGVSTRAKHPSSLLPSGLLLSIQTEQHPQQPPWNGPTPASPNNCTGFNVLIAHFL